MVTTLALATTAAAQTSSGLTDMTQVDSAYDGLGSSVTEWSGATYNADRNVILTVDDEFHAYEIQLGSDGGVDSNPSIREIIIDIGASDYEGIAWISGDRYAILSEGTGTAYIVDVPPEGRFIRPSDLVWSFEAGGPDGNTGSEGIATDGDAFYVADEMPSSLSKYTADGDFVAKVSLPELGDATGVVVVQDGTYLVLSDESAKLSHYDIDWDARTADEIAEYSLSGFPQVEGIALIGNTDLHIFGELKSGQTYSHLVGEIVPPPPPPPRFSRSDVDCSGESDVIDAVMIMQSSVQTRVLDQACGNGDANGDNVLNVIDALIVVQCRVGVQNGFCELAASPN